MAVNWSSTLQLQRFKMAAHLAVRSTISRQRRLFSDNAQFKTIRVHDTGKPILLHTSYVSARAAHTDTQDDYSNSRTCAEC